MHFTRIDFSQNYEVLQLEFLDKTGTQPPFLKQVPTCFIIIFMKFKATFKAKNS